MQAVWCCKLYASMQFETGVGKTRSDLLTPSFVPLIDWISDTCPQGCTDLQSPVKCLDHHLLSLSTPTPKLEHVSHFAAALWSYCHHVLLSRAGDKCLMAAGPVACY